MARRLPGGTSTCSASMIFRTRSCETESEFDPQNWWTKWGAIFGVAQSPKIQSIKGDKRNGHVAFGTFVGADQTGELRVARRGNQIYTTTGTVKIRAI